MDLFLIRHADALPVGEAGQNDIDRPLSPRGQSQAKELGRVLQSRYSRIDRVLTSPLLRARQTAEELCASRGIGTPALVACKELAPGGKRRKLSRILRGLDGKRLAVVGHEPDLSDFAAWLIGSKKAQIDIAKSGIACLTCGEAPGKGMAVLRWLVTPDWYS